MEFQPLQYSSLFSDSFHLDEANFEKKAPTKQTCSSAGVGSGVRGVCVHCWCGGGVCNACF